jgi:AcrR family transcriptional regulator
MRQTLAEGARLGFPLTRLVASLEWADPETMSDLLSYEARLDRVLQKLPDVVVCTYDLNRHGGRAIVEVLGVHPVALIGGVVRTSGGAARASARDRLLAAAAQLFYENGIQATGVDSIIDAAGVAKATFYRHYPSKDDLVAAWLRDPRARWLDRLRAQVEALDAEPAEKIPRFFDALADWLESGGYRGCPYLNAAIEITDPTHPARSVVVDYLQEIEDYLVGLVAAAGYRHPQRLGEQLQALVTGATSLAVARGSSASVTAAREAALRLLNSAERD